MIDSCIEFCINLRKEEVAKQNVAIRVDNNSQILFHPIKLFVYFYRIGGGINSI